jgi:hypothetical protein
MDPDFAKDASLIDELGRKLDALRRFDQYFCDADWRPRHGRRPCSPEDGVVED